MIAIPLIGGAGAVHVVLRRVSKIAIRMSGFRFAVASSGNLVGCSGGLLRSRALACCPCCHVRNNASVKAHTSKSTRSDGVDMTVTRVAMKHLIIRGGPHLAVAGGRAKRPMLSVPLIGCLLLARTRKRRVAGRRCLSHRSRCGVAFFLSRDVG